VDVGAYGAILMDVGANVEAILMDVGGNIGAIPMDVGAKFDEVVGDRPCSAGPSS
jgi:hypothetical protein